MEILFQDRKLGKIWNNQSQLIRNYGQQQAKLLRRRLDDLIVADTLEDIRFLPQVRCHELKGNRQGQFAVDVVHPYRLIFEPANDPIPRKDDGGFDWTKITAIRVIAVENYHD